MRFIQIDKLDEGQYRVFNKKSLDQIGYIEYYSKWRKHIFMPDNETIYDTICLKELSEYLEKIDRQK